MQTSELCKSRRELSNAYLLAKFGFDPAENEPYHLVRRPSPSGLLAVLAGLLARDAIISFRPRDPEDRLDSRSSLRIPIWG